MWSKRARWFSALMRAKLQRNWQQASTGAGRPSWEGRGGEGEGEGERQKRRGSTCPAAHTLDMAIFFFLRWEMTSLVAEPPELMPR